MHVPQPDDRQGVVVELGHPRHQLLGVRVDDLVQQRVLTGDHRHVPIDFLDDGFVVEWQLLVRDRGEHRDPLDERQVERHVAEDYRLLELRVNELRARRLSLSPGAR